MQNFNEEQNLFAADFIFNIGKHTTKFGKIKSPPICLDRAFENDFEPRSN